MVGGHHEPLNSFFSLSKIKRIMFLRAHVSEVLAAVMLYNKTSK